MIQPSFASQCDFESKDEWVKLLQANIDDLKEQYSKSPAITNAIITKEYAQLMKSNERRIRIIGYFYSEASFHLGRITRYKQWPQESERRNEDHSKIRGRRLKVLLNISPNLISSKLMHYSEQLFYELFWSLLAYDICGELYTLNLIKNENLKKFYLEKDPNIAFKYFLSFEQTYLQNTLYRDLWVRPIMKAGVVDKMRWISFPNLDGSLNFKSWCKENKCRTSSFNLNNRILFDLYTLQIELNKINSDGLNNRIQLSNSLEINQEFLDLNFNY